ncbi:phage tail protein [Enterobacter hormaechei]|uniref:phage tail protein n=1 Tax=Enterobacter hormaechei TaxID=158836 RepID=UPI003C2F56DD
MAAVEQDSAGRWLTAGLSPRSFNTIFNKIQKAQRSNRRGARRTLTPGMLHNKELEKFLQLGKKKEGTFFTADDMKQFIERRKAHRSTFASDVPGITWSQLAAQSTKADIDRASNRVDDGTGISKAMFIGLQHDLALVNVAASDVSKHQNHRVRIRFETWDQAVEEAANPEADINKITRKMCADRVSIDCDCGRHQYWFRYMATAGNYCVAPPKEYAFPKIRNPDLKGVACKHLLHAMNRFQSRTWQMQLATQLRKSAKRVSFGDDAKKTSRFFSEEEMAAMARNRRNTIDQGALRKAFEQYQRNQDNFSKSMKGNKQAVEKLRSSLKKSRTLSQQQKKALKEAQEREKKLIQERDAAKKLLQDQLKVKKNSFIDALRMAGKTKVEAEDMFKQWLEQQMRTQ